MIGKIKVLRNVIPSIKRLEIKVGNNQPVMRQKLIMDVLKSDECKSKFDCEDVKIDEKDSVTSIISRMKSIHNSTMIDFFQNCYSDWKSAGEDSQYLCDTPQTSCTSIGITPINFTRTNKYLDKIPLWRHIGYYACDNFTPIYEHTFDELISCGKSMMLATEILLDKSRRHNVVYCCNSVPSHHAEFENYGGFSYVNFTAMGTQLLSLDGRVAVLDLDIHHGNGTENIFQYNRSILPISIHIDPNLDYPGYSGFASSNIEDKHLTTRPLASKSGKELNRSKLLTRVPVNIPLPKGTNISTYLSALDFAQREIENFDVKYLVIAFGGDTFVKDPEVSCRGGFNMELDDYSKIGKFIGKFASRMGLPILVCQEGGYNLEAMPRIVHNFLCGLEEL